MSSLNVYNDSDTFAAVTYLLDRVETLPPVAFMAGDFNLQDPMWEPGSRLPNGRGRNVARREQLIELASEQLGLALANDQGGPVTWLGGKRGVTHGVIDLVWVDPSLGTVDGVEVDALNRSRSDHAIPRWEIPVDVEPQKIPNVKRGSEEGVAYVRTCRSLFNAIPLEYESREHVEDTGNWIGERLEDIWEQHATVPRPSRRSKSWWSLECSALVKEVRELRVERRQLAVQRRLWQARVVRTGHNFDLEWHREVVRLTKRIAVADARLDRLLKRMKGAVRRAKRQFFDSIMEKTHPSRIWDMVGWTRLRKMAATTGLVDQDGQPADQPEKLARVFQDQFTPENPRNVDRTIVDEMP